MPGNIWFGDKSKCPPKGNPPSHFMYTTETFTVRELIAELSKFNGDLPVGVCLTSIHGHVAGVKGLKTDEYGCVILDQTEECLYDDEVKV